MYTLTLLSVLVAAVLLLYSLAKKRFKYWQQHGVPTLDNQNVVFGDLARVFLGRENFAIRIDRAYYEFKSKGCKFGGIYSLNNPMLLLIDPELIRLVLNKDFEYFADRRVEYDAEKNPISAHMFSLDGEEWKFVRRRLSPTFTSGKLKSMFWIIEENVDKLCDFIKRNSAECIYFKDLIERTGMDIISQTAFGLNGNILESGESPFYQTIQKVFNPRVDRIIYYAFKKIFKNHANIVLLQSDDQKCNEFFLEIVDNAIKYRKKNNVRVGDFLQLLMDLMEPKDGEKGLSLNSVTAQAFVFFVAAYETTSKALDMAMYELGKDLELQEKMRAEIVKALQKADGKFSYQTVMECQLLDLFVKENLRKNPPVLFLNRCCSKPYKLPGTDIEIDKGTPIIIPIYSIHMDPDNYPKPQSFDLYRFSKENESILKPHTFLSFGEGPRYCIGNRFALYQVKITIMKLLQNFKIAVNPKTEEPLMIRPITNNLLYSLKQKIYYDFEKNE